MTMTDKMPPRPPQLRCPKCSTTYGITVVFDHCDVSWPNQQWLGFTCPTCDQFSHVEIAGERVAIGDIDGAPGPAFFPDDAVDVPGLAVEKKFRGLALTLGARRWQVKGKGKR